MADSSNKFANEEFTFDKTKYRTKFEVFAIEWNNPMDLVALASKTGEIVVKRFYWKTGWKRNFEKDNLQAPFEQIITGHRQTPGSSSPPIKSSKDSLESIQWSPRGDLLAVVFESGRLYFLDTQTGRTVYFKKLESAPQQMRWLKIFPTKRIWDETSSLVSTQFTISANDFSFSENASRDHGNLLAVLETFSQRTFGIAMVGTILCVAHVTSDEAFVDIFACGILPISRLNISHVLTRQKQLEFDPSSIEIHDILITEKGGVQISCKFMGFRKPDAHNTAKTHSELDQYPTIGWISAIIEFDVILNEEKMRIYARIADCLSRMTFCALYLQEMFAYMSHNWKSQSEAFHQRIFRQGSREEATECSYEHCRDFLLAIITGVQTPALAAFLTGGATTLKELKLASVFVDEYFTVLLKGLAFFQPAIKMFQQYVISLNTSLSKLFEIYEKEKSAGVDPTETLLNNLKEIASGRDPFSADAAKGHEEFISQFELALFVLEKRVKELTKVAEENRNELKLMLRWLEVLSRESSGIPPENADENYDDIPLEVLTKLFSRVIACSTFENSASSSDWDKLEFLNTWKNRLDAGPEAFQQLRSFKCALDRVLPFLLPSKAGDDLSLYLPAAASTTLEQLEDVRLLTFCRPVGKQRCLDQLAQCRTILTAIQMCFQPFRTFFGDGVENIFQLDALSQVTFDISPSTGAFDHIRKSRASIVQHQKRWDEEYREFKANEENEENEFID